MKKLLCLLGGAMLMPFIYGQQNQFKTPNQPYYIGSHFNMKSTFGKVINYKDTTVCLQDFDDKIIVLDFWHTGCTSCLNAFPGEVKLQTRYKDHIQLIAVTHQPVALVNRFLKKWDDRTGVHLNFPIIAEGEALQKAFRFRAEPHYVWIFPNGYVAGQTSASFVTDGNIKALIEEWRTLKSILDGSLHKKDVFLNY